MHRAGGERPTTSRAQPIAEASAGADGECWGGAEEAQRPRSDCCLRGGQVWPWWGAGRSTLGQADRRQSAAGRFRSGNCLDECID